MHIRKVRIFQPPSSSHNPAAHLLWSGKNVAQHSEGWRLIRRHWIWECQWSWECPIVLLDSFLLLCSTLLNVKDFRKPEDRRKIKKSSIFEVRDQTFSKNVENKIDDFRKHRWRKVDFWVKSSLHHLQIIQQLLLLKWDEKHFAWRLEKMREGLLRPERT